MLEYQEMSPLEIKQGARGNMITQAPKMDSKSSSDTKPDANPHSDGPRVSRKMPAIAESGAEEQSA